MNDTKVVPGFMEKDESNSPDDEAMTFWGERAKVQRYCMDEVAAYLG